jgi:hypothetical protein
MNQSISIFQTSPNKWKMTVAIPIYDKSKQYDSFSCLLEAIQRDIGTVVGKQPTFKKSGESIMKLIEVRYRI